MVNKKKQLILVVVAAVIGIAVYVSLRVKPDVEKIYKVRRGDLEVVVNCKGEVKGEKFVEINMPPEVCDEELRIYQLKIADVILEGKAVKKGDYIAKLDESQIMTMMRDVMQEKEVMDADLRNVVIDSTVNLSRKREGINNAKLDLEYLKIDLEQSKFESEAYQRKTQMRYEKAELEVDRIRRDYLLDRNRMKLHVSRFQERVAERQDRISRYQRAMAATTIRTPEDGIVMFAKDWSGKTYGKGSDINIWRPLIAMLPDMSVAITETYIREIDISKIEMGDSVRISIDAIPNKSFVGKVIKIATIGEDHKDFDMKVFKVIIRFEHSDPDMKPGMSSNNDVVVASFRDKLLVPKKAVFSKNGKQIIYLKKGTVTELEIGILAENDEFCVVENSIQEGDKVLLYQPEEFKTNVVKVASK